MICVKHRDGTCATGLKQIPADGSVNNQETLCGHAVVLPAGYEIGEPTCKDCLAKIKGEEL